MARQARTPELLARLPEAERTALLAIALRRSYRRNNPIFLEGDPGDAFYLLVRGTVAVRVTTAEGHVATLAVLGPGDSFGEVALTSSEGVRSAAVFALEPVEVIVIGARAFAELRQRQPAVDRLVIEVLTRTITRLSGQVRDALFVPVEGRVTKQLSALAKVYGERLGSNGEIVIPITQADLSSMVGAARPTCNAVLQRLAVDGIVDLGR
jgi:CRP-like cAMP-binding protein